ncbi:hypothetical protein M885DRAFT_626031, partial [Pelagophyceae sp. CCMP2097]
MCDASFESQREIVVLLVPLGDGDDDVARLVSARARGAFGRMCDAVEATYGAEPTRALRDLRAPEGWRGWGCESGRDSSFERFDWKRGRLRLRFVRWGAEAVGDGAAAGDAGGDAGRVRAAIGLRRRGARAPRAAGAAAPTPANDLRTVLRLATAAGADATRCECAALEEDATPRAAGLPGAAPADADADAARRLARLDGMLVDVVVALHAEAQISALERAQRLPGPLAAGRKHRLGAAPPKLLAAHDSRDAARDATQRGRRCKALADVALLLGCAADAAVFAAAAAAELKAAQDPRWHAAALVAWCAAALDLDADPEASGLATPFAGPGAAAMVPPLAEVSALPAWTGARQAPTHVDGLVLAAATEALGLLTHCAEAAPAAQKPQLRAASTQLALKVARWHAGEGRKRAVVAMCELALETTAHFSQTAAACAKLAAYAGCHRKAALFAARGASKAVARRNWHEAHVLWQLVPADEAWAVVKLAALRGIADAAECCGDASAPEAWARVLSHHAILQKIERGAQKLGSTHQTFVAGGLRAPREATALYYARRRRLYLACDATSSAAQKSAISRLENTKTATTQPALCELEKVRIHGPAFSRVDAHEWEAGAGPASKSNFMFDPFKKRRDQLRAAESARGDYDGLWVRGERHTVQVELCNTFQITLDVRSATIQLGGARCCARPAQGFTVKPNATATLTFDVTPLEAGVVTVQAVVVAREATRFTCVLASSRSTASVTVVEPQPVLEVSHLEFVRRGRLTLCALTQPLARADPGAADAAEAAEAPPPTKIVRAGEAVELSLQLRNARSTRVTHLELSLDGPRKGVRRVFWKSTDASGHAAGDDDGDAPVRIVDEVAFRAAFECAAATLDATLRLSDDLAALIVPASDYLLSVRYSSSNGARRDVAAPLRLVSARRRRRRDEARAPRLQFARRRHPPDRHEQRADGRRPAARRDDGAAPGRGDGADRVPRVGLDDVDDVVHRRHFQRRTRRPWRPAATRRRCRLTSRQPCATGALYLKSYRSQ